MQDLGFYIKRDRYEPSHGREDRNDPQSAIVTDLPGKETPPKPRDLPSPRHRPGEPILYDPPLGEGRDAYTPLNDSVADPFTGRSMIDPTRF